MDRMALRASVSRSFFLCLVFLLISCSPGDEPAPSPQSSSAAASSSSVAQQGPAATSFELSVAELTPSGEGEFSLSGEVTLPDGAELSAVEALLDAELDGQPLALEWEPIKAPVTYRFEVPAIGQTDEPQTLTLRWNGEAVGSPQKGQRTLTVPAIDQFAVTGARVVRSPEVYVSVSFSKPLSRRQNLNGLVQLNDEDARVQVDGTRLRVYPDEVPEGEVTLRVLEVIRSADEQTLASDYQDSLVLKLETPGVRFTGSSSILPPADQLSVPFEAANVDSVQVTAFKVFEGNMGQFLQYHSLTEANMDDSTGRYLWRKTYRLPEPATEGWQRYNLDLTELMAEHPDGMIQLALSVDQSNSLYPCDQPRPDSPQDEAPQSHEGDWSYENNQKPAWYQRYYQSQGYWVYSERNNPCHQSYYRYSDQVQARRAFQVSGIGLLAKLGGGDQLDVIATDLVDAEPLPGTTLRVYNFQQQPIGEGATDEYGMASLTVDGQPYYLMAEREGKTGYLRLARNEALPTNQFDVGGESVRDGLKGFIYGERDVWRPGDDIHLTFILEDPDNVWPANHPVTLDLFDPRGNKVTSEVAREPVDGFYTYTLSTDEAAPTGNWRAVVHLGNRVFDKVLPIETIMPNRLKMDLAFAQTPLRLDAMPAKATLSARWLHGASAAGLKADSQVRLSPKTTTFEGYSQFTFDDPARDFQSATQSVFEGNLNADGETNFEVRLPVASPPPGQLRATFINRVFEPGGAFSTALRRFDYLPFEQWVGLQVPKGDGYNGAIARNQSHPVTLQSLGSDGEPLAERELELTLYKVDWRWWWDRGNDDLAIYVASENRAPIKRDTLTTDQQGRANWTLEKDTYDWGRYLLRVCDAAGSHCAGELIYLGWSRQNAVNPATATQLMLSTDQDEYQVGDTATVRLPAIEKGRVLLSLENGREVLERRWLDLEPGQTDVAIPVTAAMAPNVYAHISVLLPHQQRASDAPMRLYGLVPIMVEDPSTRLEPELNVPEQVRPESRFDITVTEANQRAMTYTLAVVDEGLLGITGYRTPDPHKHFYQREALGVYTWDLFDQVVGAYGASLQRVLAIGGSDAEDEDDGNPRERRFPPVVKFLGPFTLEAGQSRDHSVELPPYLGEVRVMLVAGKNQAYGKAEQSVTVTQPLSLLATLPRVVGPGETISLPVQVFANDEGIDEVAVTAEASDLFTVPEGEGQLNLADKADGIVELTLKVNDQIGKGQVTVTARSGDEVATQTIHIESRAPNPPSVRAEQAMVAPGEEWTASLEAHGMAGTNSASVEVSRLPPLNLERRLGYLLNYPHGCLEQTTSTAFPQLYLHKLVELSDAQAREREDNIRAAIEKLGRFQLADGQFSYWPGARYANDWASLYAGHFLTEARRLGYGVPTERYNRWLSQAQADARRFRYQNGFVQVQAYRLYVLALAEEADTAAMNRLREQLRQDTDVGSATSRRLLASAYYQLGLPDAGQELVTAAQGLPEYEDPGYTYGSALRDRAIWLQLQVRAGNRSGAWDQAEMIAEQLSEDRWYSTQSVAWSLLALAEFAGEQSADQPMDFSLKTGSDWQPLQSQQHWYRQALTSPQVAVRNESEQPLRVMVTNRGTPAAADERATSEGLSLDVRFSTPSGEPLDIRELPQGTDFMANITVTGDFSELGRSRIEDIALSLVMPSGWQIRNERLEGGDSPQGFDYLDIRDDRVLGYFSLWRDYRWQWRYNDRRQEQVTLQVVLNASYEGEFYLPGWRADAMYNERIHANTEGQWVRVVNTD